MAVVLQESTAVSRDPPVASQELELPPAALNSHHLSAPSPKALRRRLETSRPPIGRETSQGREVNRFSQLVLLPAPTAPVQVSQRSLSLPLFRIAWPSRIAQTRPRVRRL